MLFPEIQKQPSEVFFEKRCSCKFKRKPLCQSLFLEESCRLCNFIKKETLAQVFSCEFCEISKNTFFYRTPLEAASENLLDFIMAKYFKLE